MKKEKKYFIIGGLILIAALFLIFRGGNDEHQFMEVKEHQLVKEVFETGPVKSGREVNFSFSSPGRLNRLYYGRGEVVEEGELIASFDKSDLLASRRKAEQNLRAAQAELESVLEGGREEDILSMENRLKEAKDAVSLSERALEEAKRAAEINLKNIYSTVPSVVNNSYLLSKEIKDTLEEIQNIYFVGLYLPDTYRARREVTRVDEAYKNLRDVSRKTTTLSKRDEMDLALKKAEEAFTLIEESIEVIIDVSDNDFYKERFTKESKEALSLSKEMASEMLSKVVAFQGEISLVKEKGESSITSAESALSATRSRKNEIEDNLEKIKLGGRSFQVEAAESRVEAAREDLRLIDREIERADIYAPGKGRVIGTYFKEGEEVSPGSPVITFLQEEDFYVELDIYEGDIVSIYPGQKATIELVPFPREEFFGEVLSIEEAGRVIDGVVHYRIKVSIEDPPKRLMSEMTADVVVEVERKETLSLPREAIRRDGIKRYVYLLENGDIKEREVEVGLTDSYGFVEIISGLEKGEKVLVD